MVGNLRGPPSPFMRHVWVIPYDAKLGKLKAILLDPKIQNSFRWTLGSDRSLDKCCKTLEFPYSQNVCLASGSFLLFKTTVCISKTLYDLFLKKVRKAFYICLFYCRLFSDRWLVFWSFHFDQYAYLFTSVFGSTTVYQIATIFLKNIQRMLQLKDASQSLDAPPPPPNLYASKTYCNWRW